MTRRKAAVHQVQIAHLRAGERFLWAGHVVTFQHAQDHHQTRFGRRWRRLIVQLGNGEEHALWYEDKERVTLAGSDPVG